MACAPRDVPSGEDGAVRYALAVHRDPTRWGKLSFPNTCIRSDPKKPSQGAHSGVLNPPAYGGVDEKQNDHGLPKPCKVEDASARSLYQLAPYWGPGAPWRMRQRLAHAHDTA